MMTTMLTGAVFALSACQTEPEQAYNFSNVEKCYSEIPDGVWMKEWKPICDESYKNAKTSHELEAPRYAQAGSDGDDLCEEVHGDDQCYKMTDSSGNSWFVPFMAGYLIHSAFDSRTNKYAYGSSSAKPLYKTSTGGYTNSTFAYNTSRLNSASRVSSNPTRYSTPSTPKTYTSAPTIRSSGGFGASSTSSRSASYGG